MKHLYFSAALLLVSPALCADSGDQGGFQFSAEALFISQRLAFRLGQSDWFVGGEFNYTDLTINFDQRNEMHQLDELSFDSTNTSLGAVLVYDSLNNTFTPVAAFRVRHFIHARMKASARSSCSAGNVCGYCDAPAPTTGNFTKTSLTA